MRLQIKEMSFPAAWHSMSIIVLLKHELGMESHMQILLTIAMVASIAFHINLRVVCSALGEVVLLR